MTKRQKLALEQSEKRQRMQEILDADELTDEQRAELDGLTKRMQHIEVEMRAAIVAEGDPIETRQTRTEDAEERERLELRSKFRVHRVITSALQGKRPDGTEAEYAAAVGLGAGSIPIDVFEREQRAEHLERETRAITPGAEGGTSQAPIVPAIFDRSIAPYLGIEMPSAGVGDQAYPVLSTSVTADVKAKSATAPETAGAFTVTTVQPRRITGSFRFRVEDAARLAGMEESLRENLSMVLTDELDDQVLNGSAASGGEDGKIRGLLGILTDPAAPAAGAETWARYNTALTDAIDGLFSVDAMSIRALVGPHTYRHMAQQFRASESNESFAAYWARIGGGVRATRRIADPASNIQQAVVRRGNPMGGRVAVMPAWDSMTIRDVYSGAGKGEIVVTAFMLVGDVVVLRGGAFLQDSFRLG
ncbi:hypothetical protein [Candidatus Palauibacter sp.]|uniref:hypothetical protein n=1 Tax=Candidatus Palauibacter sp. TaxID=3101350 RepID=UPI003B01DEAD